MTGGHRNILINKDCYIANETTNQVVGSSNLPGRANILEYYQAVFKLAGNRSLFECQQRRSVAELFSADAICRFKKSFQLRRRVLRRDVAVLANPATPSGFRPAHAARSRRPNVWVYSTAPED